MNSIVSKAGILFISAVVLCATASAGTVAIGYVSWDVTFPGNAGQFDIVNLTGPNYDPPPALDFPVLTTVALTSLSLKVDFVGGTSTTYGSSYFTLAPDGESFTGTSIPIGGTNPEPLDATLTGTFSPTTITWDTDTSGDTTTKPIVPSFSVFFNDSSSPNPGGNPNLVDGDLGVISATTATLSGVPEPGTWILFGTGLLILAVSRRRFWKGNIAMSALKSSLSALCAVAVLTALAQPASAVTGPAVTLTSITSPASGAAGISNVNITGSGFPSGTITPANVVVTWATTCDGTPVTTDTANSVRTVLGTTRRIDVNVPSGLTTGNYFLIVADSAGGDADFVTKTGSCAEVQVTGSTAVLNACVAGSSLGVLLPAGGAAGNVTAYVPKGYWEASSNTGVYVQNIEGTIGSASTIATPNAPNSCSSNPATGQTVCVADNTDVYLITGTTLNTTLTSGSNTTAGFSGGTCNNCGVAVNANNNTAVINMGLSGSDNGGLQILNLNTNTFNTAFPLVGAEVSENISVDPTRSLVLTAGEGGNYTLAQIQTNGSLLEYDSSFSTELENDSSAEDCSTGVAIAPGEFSTEVALVNLNAITFTPGSPGTYTAPNAVATLAVSQYTFPAAGVSGSAVAQGSGHLAVLADEFGDNEFAVLKLPATAGTGVPALVDYAIAQIPNSTACGGTFSLGFDPHTVTAYTSPNTGDSYAVFAGYSGSLPVCLAVVDMTTVINPTLSPRGLNGYGANEVDPTSLPAGAVTFFPL